VNAWQIPISVAGATTKDVMITPGDFIVADDDGVIVIPSDKIMTVLERAEQLTDKEVQIRRELQNGLSLADALAKFGHV
jgi:regulator of RNase E activity RraA